MTEREELFHIATHSNNPAWRWLPNNAEMLRFVDYLLANGVTIQKWIPVTERLPEKEGSYLVCSKTGKVYTSHYYTEKKCSEWYTRKAEWSHPNVTHWMPLPEPPKEAP